MTITCEGYNKKKCVILGKKKEAEELCEQLFFLDKRPDLIVLTDPFSCGEYKSIPEVCEKELENLELAHNGVIVPAGIFSYEAINIIGRYQAELQVYIVRDIEFLSRSVIEKAEDLSKSVIVNRQLSGVGIGLQLGFVMGGVESWASNLFWQIKKDEALVKFYEPIQESTYKYVGPDFYKIPIDCVERIGPYQLFGEYVVETLRRICINPPKVYVDNGSYRMLSAVWIAKKVLGLNICVVSVVHNDYELFYTRLSIFGEIIDRVIAVSRPIFNKVNSLFPNQFGDVRVKLQVPKPVNSLPIHNRGPLKIAYASRLEPSNKRSMWICKVLDMLVEKRIDFTLDIAGDGCCRTSIEEYVYKNNLQKQVHLLGHISYDKMKEFWKEHEVFINFSMVEGGPLTLFESMGNGLVPIVTEAGWGNDLVRSGRNGYIIHTPEDVVEKIAILSQDHKKLETMRIHAWKTMMDFYSRNENLEGILF